MRTCRGAEASWLVRLAPDRAVRAQALAGDIVLCSWARHLTLTVPLQVYKRISANFLLGVTPRWTGISTRGEWKYSYSLQATETGISSGLVYRLFLYLPTIKTCMSVGLPLFFFFIALNRKSSIKQPPKRKTKYTKKTKNNSRGNLGNSIHGTRPARCHILGQINVCITNTNQCKIVKK